METPSIAQRLRSAILPTLLILLAFASAAFVAADFYWLRFVSNNVTLVGRDLTGMSAEQVRATVDEAVSTPAMLPLTVGGDNRSWTLDPKPIVTVDVDGMVAQAYAPSRNASLIERMTSRIGKTPLAADVKPAYQVNEPVLADWVRQTATAVDRPPVDAKRSLAGYGIQITPAIYGATVEQTRAVDELSAMLTSVDAMTDTASRTASLPITYATPAVLESSFKSAIVVDLSACKVFLYDGATLVKTYPCAPGRPSWPTPKGDFKVTSKLKNSAWYNPHSSWSAGMPDMIPGGPSNPMGDRKIGISYPGVFLHGIPRSEFSSIGTHASHGCMRMFPKDIHDLFPRVNIGDPVWIRN